MYSYIENVDMEFSKWNHSWISMIRRIEYSKLWLSFMSRQLYTSFLLVTRIVYVDVYVICALCKHVCMCACTHIWICLKKHKCSDEKPCCTFDKWFMLESPGLAFCLDVCFLYNRCLPWNSHAAFAASLVPYFWLYS